MASTKKEVKQAPPQFVSTAMRDAEIQKRQKKQTAKKSAKQSKPKVKNWQVLLEQMPKLKNKGKAQSLMDLIRRHNRSKLSLKGMESLVMLFNTASDNEKLRYEVVDDQAGRKFKMPKCVFITTLSGSPLSEFEDTIDRIREEREKHVTG